MTEEKICPIMTRQSFVPHDPERPLIPTGLVQCNVYCQREKCMAWVESVDEEITCKEGYAPNYGDCKEARSDDDCNYCSLGRLTTAKEGYCKLIGRTNE